MEEGQGVSGMPEHTSSKAKAPHRMEIGSEIAFDCIARRAVSRSPSESGHRGKEKRNSRPSLMSLNGLL